MSMLLRIAACICFALVVVGVPTFNVPMLPLGLLCWCVSTMVS